MDLTPLTFLPSGIHTLYNSLPFSIGGDCKYDGTSLND